MESGSSGLSPHARSQLAVLDEARRKWEHIQALVEQAAARKTGQFHDGGAGAQEQRVRNIMGQVRRAAADVAELLVERKFVALSAEAEQLVVFARPAGTVSKATLYGMREVAKSVWNGLEMAEADVRRSDREDPED